MTATDWIKNTGLFQSATFNLNCFKVLIHQCGQTNCCASTAGEVVYQISGAGMTGQGSEEGWNFLSCCAEGRITIPSEREVFVSKKAFPLEQAHLRILKK